jgi:MOSC domain-containing protein YiiM
LAPGKRHFEDIGADHRLNTETVGDYARTICLQRKTISPDVFGRNIVASGLNLLPLKAETFLHSWKWVYYAAGF